MRSFAIEVSGHQYRGAWKTENDGQIEVRSDYGTERLKLGARDPSQVARQVLEHMIPRPPV